MDHKTRLWRKKYTERSIIASDRVELSSQEKEEEVQMLLTDNAELQKNIKCLNEKLSIALSECTAKDNLINEHVKAAQEAIAGSKMTEIEVVSLKQELDKALQRKEDSEDRVAHLDAALKECMQQLCFVREQQERRIQDAVIKISTEFDESQTVLEEKLAETSKRLAKVEAENTHLTKALLKKEASVEDIHKQKAQIEADVSALMSRLESMGKENGSLKYNVHVLEKELDIRNEEREFNRRAADASHRQHLENVKKIAKLESECQRLRLLVRKRLPGPAALAKMKIEVEMLGGDSYDMRRRKFNASPTLSSPDLSVDNSPDTPRKNIGFRNQQLCSLEEENKSLKEALSKKINELRISKGMFAQAASKLSQVESQLEESSKGRSVVEPARSSLVYEVSQTSISDVGSDDKASCADSWASALISELEHFKNGKQRGLSSCQSIGASDINLMDDFLEMEKLALVTVDKPSGTCQTSSDGVDGIVGPPETKGGEIVPVPGSMVGLNMLNQDMVSEEKSGGEQPGWLQDILKVVTEQIRNAQKNPKEILEDVRQALDNVGGLYARKIENATRNHPDELNISGFSGGTNKKPLDITSVKPISKGITDIDSSSMEKADLSKSLSKVIELLEGISLPSSDYDNLEISSKNDGSFFSYKNSPTPTGYLVRVLQWKTSELNMVLEQFVHTCYDLLSGKADLKKFAQELSSALDWILNHCFSLQDVSSMKYAIKNNLDLDETRSESEAEVGTIGPSLEADKFSVSLPVSIASNRRSNFSQLEEFNCNTRKSAIRESELLKNQLMESEISISRLQKELGNSQKSNGMTQDQSENHKLTKDDFHTQLVAAKAELNEAWQKCSSLQVELENKANCCEELESKCLELQLQLESVTEKGAQNYDHREEEKKFRTDWEITAASEKLAECQETILNLGKQLKALAPPGEAILFDKLICAPTNAAPKGTSTTIMVPASSLPKTISRSQRSSLFDQMLAEDDAKAKYRESSIANETVDGVKHPDDDARTHSLAIVPSKKKGGGSLWKKLLWRKKSNKKMRLPFPT